MLILLNGWVCVCVFANVCAFVSVCYFMFTHVNLCVYVRDVCEYDSVCMYLCVRVVCVRALLYVLLCVGMVG